MKKNLFTIKSVMPFLKHIFILIIFWSVFCFSGRAQPPVINSFSPFRASMGTAIAVSGNYFTGATAVSFGDIPADSFTVISNMRIIVKAPRYAVGGYNKNHLKNQLNAIIIFHQLRNEKRKTVNPSSHS